MGVRERPSVAAMTLEEKLGQLTMVAADFAVTGPNLPADYLADVRAGRAGSLLNLWGMEAIREVQRVAVEETRLGIPLLFGFDVLHGHRTIFPIPLGEASAFDPALWQRTAAAAAAETAADGVALTFAPMLDVTRDPRWGRIAESPGEDPWIACRYAEAKVRGFQQDSLRDGVAATAKHLGGYGAVTAGREYASVDISERSLLEVHLPAFRAAVDAGAAAIMPAFTDLGGVPMTANGGILRSLLRESWGFRGVIVSDYGAVAELVAHGVASDLAEAAGLALRAGVDIDMMGSAYLRGLPAALQRGTVSMAEIDAAVERVFALKEALGLFDDPWRCGTAPDRAATRALARETARRSIVLLTNRGDRLPLGADLRRIAVIGPFADAGTEMLGPWAAAGVGDEAVTVLAGLRAALPDVAVEHVPGVDLDGNDRGAAVALERAGEADVVLLCLGEGAETSGEAASRGRPELPPEQRALAERVLALGKPVIAILFGGRPLIVPWLVERADAVLMAWFPGSEGGNAIADVLCGAWNPGGRLPVSWPADTGQIPIFYAQRPTGRPADPRNRYSSKYIDIPLQPLFPFGHGLSYTRFEISDLRVTPGALRRGESARVEVDVANTGGVAGEETLFLFVRDPVAAVARPVLELKGVAKADLPPGGRKRVAFDLPAEALTYLGPDLRERLDPGEVRLFVGTSAEPAGLLETGIMILADHMS